MSKVRTVRIDEKKEIMHMWDVVFGESNAYMQLYFGRKFRPERCMAVEQDGKLVSSLEILPYPFAFHKMMAGSGYLSGVATLPEYRGRGLMGQMLIETFRYQRQLGQLVSTLIPASHSLYDLYEKYGFVTAFRLQNQVIDRDSTTQRLPITQLEGTLSEQVYDCYERHQRRYAIGSLKTPDDLDVVALEHRAGGGEIWAVQGKEQVDALAFAIWQGKKLWLKEVIAENEVQRMALVQTLMAHYRVQQCELTTGGCEDGTPLGMARVVHVQRALSFYAMAHPYQHAVLKINDPLVPENCGTYVLQGGECQLVPEETNALEVDIALLTKFLLLGGSLDGLQHSPIHPYMNLMLN